MTKYLISFPSEAMVVAPDELPQVAADSLAVIEEAKRAGVYVFGGGIDEEVGPVLVSADGALSGDVYSGRRINGGMTILELPSCEEAVVWARKLAIACRCPQELRAFMFHADA